MVSVLGRWRREEWDEEAAGIAEKDGVEGERVYRLKGGADGGRRMTKDGWLRWRKPGEEGTWWRWKPRQRQEQG
jgi:hypothetical protein